MKSCRYCGMLNDDESRFCIRCGQALGTEPPYAENPPASSDPNGAAAYPPAAGQPAGQPYIPYYSAYPAPGMPNSRKSPAERMEGLRAVASSKLALGVIVLLFLQAALPLLTLLSERPADGNPLWEMVGRIPTALSLPFSMIPSLLIAVGLLMTYRAASDRSRKMTTAGLTMVRVVQIAQIVLMVVSLLAVIGFCLYLSNSPDWLDQLWEYFGDRSSADIEDAMGGMVIQMALVVMVFAVLIAMGLAVVPYILSIRLVGSFIASIRTGSPVLRAATAFAVFQFLFAGFTFIGLLGVMTAFSAQGLITLITDGTATALYVLSGLLALRLKKAADG